ncbi:sugar phosphate isomerase/epimerase family protein [Clostridiisalibacter paucivorans]|uniref:sugar phosphate isomerase/epimerase family protein n=1 Tax=Clostridiisalibacter paucivorans TaxID=408753 RepID=UPI00047CD5BE|nr:TIM barrel protein [Clostridiisalibacter paucivorans]
MNQQLGISVHNVGLDYIAKKNFKRVQLCHNFSSTKDITSLLKLSRKSSIKVGCYAPIFHQFDPTTTYYLHSNKRLRDAAFDILEENLRMVKGMPTDHMIVKLISKDMDKKLKGDQIKKMAMEGSDRLQLLGEKYNIPIFLEYSGYDDRLYKPEDWKDLVEKHDMLGLCLDTGNLHLSCKLNGMKYCESLSKIISEVKVVHLWNTRGLEDIMKYGKIPVHPEQSKEEGWIDIESTIRIVLEHDKNTPIVFRSDFKYNGFEYGQEGIDWVNGIIEKIVNE